LVTAKDVPPGGVGEIRVTFESKGYQGEVKKTITVECNDQENPTPSISLKGTVVADITINPRYLNFGFIKKGQPANPLTLTILIREGKGLKVTGVTPDSDMILLKKQKETGQEIVYEVSLAGKIPVGRINGQITVSTNNNRSPKVFIPVHAMVQGNVKVSPQIISFGRVTPGSKPTQTLNVNQDGDKRFSIQEVKTTSPQITAQINVVKEGSHYEVKLTYDPGDKKEGRIAEKVSIIVNDPEESVLEVPVYGTINPQPVIQVQ
jgi:hypothetical protein